jgi:hypothetical protein
VKTPRQNQQSGRILSTDKPFDCTIFNETQIKSKSGNLGVAASYLDQSRVTPMSNKFFDISGTAEMSNSYQARLGFDSNGNYCFIEQSAVTKKVKTLHHMSTNNKMMINRSPLKDGPTAGASASKREIVRPDTE